MGGKVSRSDVVEASKASEAIETIEADNLSGEEPLRLENNALKAQLDSFRALAKKIKEREVDQVGQWEACIAKLNAQVSQKDEQLGTLRQEAAKLSAAHHATLAEEAQKHAVEVSNLQKAHSEAIDAKCKEFCVKEQGIELKAQELQQELQAQIVAFGAKEASSSADLQSLQQELQAVRSASASEVQKLQQEIAAKEASASSDVQSLQQELQAAKEAAASDVQKLHEDIAAKDTSAAEQVQSLGQELHMAKASAASEVQKLQEDIAAKETSAASDMQSLQEELQAARAAATSEGQKLQQELEACQMSSQRQREEANTFAARAAKLEVELNAAQEAATAADTRAKGATEREAAAVHKKILAEGSLKTAETALSAAEARANVAGRGTTDCEESTALAEVSARTAALQQELDAMTQELAAAKVAAVEADALRSDLKAKMEDLAAAKLAAVDANALQEHLKAKTEELASVRAALAAANAAKEASPVQMEDSDKVSTLQFELMAKTKELTVAHEQLQELQRKSQEVHSPKSAESEPLGEPEPKCVGMQDEQVQLLLGEMERLQEEKKKRDKVLKEFKMHQKMSIEEYVQSLTSGATDNKASAKTKAPAATPRADGKKRQAPVDASVNKRQR